MKFSILSSTLVIAALASAQQVAFVVSNSSPLQYAGLSVLNNVIGIGNGDLFTAELVNTTLQTPDNKFVSPSTQGALTVTSNAVSGWAIDGNHLSFNGSENFFAVPNQSTGNYDIYGSGAPGGNTLQVVLQSIDPSQLTSGVPSGAASATSPPATTGSAIATAAGEVPAGVIPVGGLGGEGGITSLSPELISSLAGLAGLTSIPDGLLTSLLAAASSIPVGLLSSLEAPGPGSESIATIPAGSIATIPVGSIATIPIGSIATIPVGPTESVIIPTGVAQVSSQVTGQGIASFLPQVNGAGLNAVKDAALAAGAAVAIAAFF